MSSLKEKIVLLKQNINAELDYCNSADTPYLCDAISKTENKNKVVKQIVEMVGKRGLTISQSISELEWQLNPNNVE